MTASANDLTIYLLGIYVSFVLANLFVIFLLWRSSRSSLYRDLFYVWLTGIISLVTLGLTAKSSLLLKVWGNLPVMLVSVRLAMVLAGVVGFQLSMRLFWVVGIIGIGLASLFSYLGFGSHLMALPSSIAVGFPALYAGFRMFKEKWRSSTIIIRGLAAVIFLDGLHQVDFAFAYDRPELVPLGITLGLILGSILSFFAPAAILEGLAREKGRLEAEMGMQAQLIQDARMNALGRMAGGVAHEINNPLATIALNSELAEKDLEEPDLDISDVDIRAAQGRIDKILQSARRIAKIVAGLRAFAQGPGAHEYRMVSLQDLVEDTLQLCRETIQAKRIVLQVELPPDPRQSIECRPVEISQVLLNLIFNASDAVESLSERWIRLKAQKRAGAVEMSVEDSGPGIPEDVRGRLFDPFFSTKPVGKGTGLGLSIGKGIAEAHHGSLAFDPNASHTRFVLTLPA